MNINKYTKIITNNISFNDCLNLILINLKDDLLLYNFASGFIAYLDEQKLEKRFEILFSNGRFLNKDSVKIITSKEIDNLSIVYMTKKNLFKDIFYIDIIQKTNKDVFIYLEFDKMLDNKQKKIIDLFFKKLNNLITNKNWEII